MGKRGLAIWLAGASLTVLIPAQAGEIVHFEDIKGARRAHGDLWYLALGKPVGAEVFTKPVAVRLRPGESRPLADVPEYLRGRAFTIRLEVADVSGGRLSIFSSRVRDDTRAVLVSRDGWVSVRFGPAHWQGNLPLSVRSAGTVRIRRVTICQSFEQLFGRNGCVDLVDAAYRRFGDEEILSYPLLPAAYRDHRTGQWRCAPCGKEDGIDGARLDKHYRSLLTGPLETEVGLPVPVRAPDGVVLCARMKGRYAFIARPENGRPALTHTGVEGKWSVNAIALDGAVLDADGNGIYTGAKNQAWHKANTWVDHYGTGFLELIVLLPQNEIPVNPPGSRSLAFQYLSTNGPRTVTIRLKPETEAIALVNAGPCSTQILLRSRNGYREATRVLDSSLPDCLPVKAGSIRFST